MNFSQHGRPYYKMVSMNDLRREINVHVPPLIDSEKRNGIVYKVGVDDIILNQTVANHIQEKYEDADDIYDLYDINGYSIEMKYSLLGFSCFFHQNDPDKKIFAVRMWPNFKEFEIHNNTVTSGYREIMILRDVFNYYRADAEPLCCYDETYYVDMGFYQYYFLGDRELSEDLFPIESISIKNPSFSIYNSFTGIHNG